MTKLPSLHCSTASREQIQDYHNYFRKESFYFAKMADAGAAGGESKPEVPTGNEPITIRVRDQV